MFDNKALIEVLKHKNMTHKAFADLMNISTSCISRYVNGLIQPQGQRLLKMAKVLGVMPELFIIEDGVKSEKTFDAIKTSMEIITDKLSDDERSQLISILSKKSTK